MNPKIPSQFLGCPPPFRYFELTGMADSEIRPIESGGVGLLVPSQTSRFAGQEMLHVNLREQGGFR